MFFLAGGERDPVGGYPAVGFVSPASLLESNELLERFQVPHIVRLEGDGSYFFSFFPSVVIKASASEAQIPFHPER